MIPDTHRWWESASPDELHHRQARQLRWFLRERVVPFSAHYRRLFNDQGLDVRDIRTTDDLPKIPFTSKRNLGETRDFLIIPDEGVLRYQPSTIRRVLRHGPNRAKDLLYREMRPTLMTSTTGRSADPVPFFYTEHDINNLKVAGDRLMRLCRSQPAFRHINIFPFAPHLAFWQAHYAGTAFNTFMISTGGGKVMGTAGNAELIARIDPNAIIAMPTFLYHLAQHAAAENHRWSKLSHIVLGGEKVPPGMRRKLQAFCADLGSRNVSIISTYGFTEGKMAWTECCPPEGASPSGYHLYPDMGFVEIVDPDTGERVPDGSPGEIVYTPLDSRGSVVLRYRTGDLIDGGLTFEPCPNCGRTCPRLVGQISRVSDRHRLQLGKLKGTLVDFSALEHVLDDTEGLGAWQLELRKRNDDPLETDEIIVHVVSLAEDSHQDLTRRIRDGFRRETELTPNAVLFHTWKEMRDLQGVGEELKERKFVDHRPHSGEPAPPNQNLETHGHH